MSTGQLSPKEIKELLFYLNNAKLMDKLRVLQTDVIIIITGAMLILIAGFSETFLNITQGSDFTIIIWIFTLISIGTITIFLKEQFYLTVRPKLSFVTPTFLIILILGVITAILFDLLLKFNIIIFPIFSILFAIYTYSILNPYYSNHNDVFKKNLSLLIPFFSIISGITNILGAVIFFFNPSFKESIIANQAFDSVESLIFVLFISPSLFILAFYNRKQIRNYVSNIEVQER